MPTIHTTRASVIARARQGDVKDLVRIYGPLAFAVARKSGLEHYNAEDLAQQCMLELLRTLPTFDYDCNKGSFRGYVRRIVFNRTTDFLRKKRTTGNDIPSQLPAEPRDLDAIIDHEWEKACLLEAIEQVRTEVVPTTFQAFHLSIFHEWPPERIAESLGISRNQIAQNKRRVVQRLKEIVKELDDDAR